MRLLIKPGAQFPVDAEIAKGSTAADESNLTGEATPVEKTVGDTALAGTINLWGAVEVVVTRPAAESSLQKIITLIREAQQQKAPAQQFTDKFSTFYTYVVLGLSFAMFFVWWLGFQLAPFKSAVESHSAFYRTMTLLVVSSPCALVLSIPSAVLAAIAWGARHGILFRGGAAVEKLAEVNIVCARQDRHAHHRRIARGKSRKFSARTRKRNRAAGVFAGKTFHASARPRHHAPRQTAATCSRSNSSILNPSPARACKRETRTAAKCLSAGANGWRAGVHADVIAPRARNRRRLFRGLDCRRRFAGPRRFARRHPSASRARSWRNCAAKDCARVVLTGDRQAAAEHLRAELKLDDVRAELKPEQKVAAIRELSGQGKRWR